jgi:glycosyltransferase involved in cell wall biosynthesis
MKTSVIIPLYNGLPWIIPTLRSVVAQTRPAVEIIVVDDGSTDGSLDALREFPQVRLLRNPKKGANLARSHGLSVAQSPYVAMLDQDDLWTPEHLATLEQLLDENPTAAAAVGGAVSFQSPDEPHFEATEAPAAPFDPWENFPVNRIWTPSQVLIRRETLVETGGWCVHLPGVADVHAWFRLSANAPLQRSPRATVGYRRHQNSYSGQLIKNNRHLYLERFIAAGTDSVPLRLRYHPEDTAELARRVDAIQGFARWIRAAESGSRKERALSAEYMDRILRGEDSHSSFQILEQVLYFYGINELQKSIAKKGFYVLRLLLRCPNSASRFKRILARVFWNEVKW